VFAAKTPEGRAAGGGKKPGESAYIAHTLKISFDTVRFHQKNLYRKLGIQSKSELLTLYLPAKT
jgi:FixJ family two-component response regulator